jgi:hypothetical protein
MTNANRKMKTTSKANAKNRREKRAWSGWALFLGKGIIFRRIFTVSPSNS